MCGWHAMPHIGVCTCVYNMLWFPDGIPNKISWIEVLKTGHDFAIGQNLDIIIWMKVCNCKQIRVYFCMLLIFY